MGQPVDNTVHTHIVLHVADDTLWNPNRRLEELQYQGILLRDFQYKSLDVTE